MSPAPGDVRAEWLTIAGDPVAWRSIGLTVGDDGLIPLLGTSLRLVGAPRADADEADGGVIAWALSGLPGPADGGAATMWIEARLPGPK